MRLSAGDTPLPGYRLDTFLGRGVYGERWQATGPGGTPVALKFLRLTSAQGMQQAKAVQRLAQLRHAHLLSIQAIWLLDATGNIVADVPESASIQTPKVETIVVATPLADGNLAGRLESYRQTGSQGIPVCELLQHMEDVARALDTLARTSLDLGGEENASAPLVSHGGIKPQNILLLADSAVVSDFGLSTALGNHCSTTLSTGAVAYLAPECMIEAAASPASDQYALAVCYAELRTGRLPVSEETTFVGALNQQQEGRLDLTDLPDAERGVVARATAANPEERFGSCLEMVRALQQVVDGFDVVSRPLSPPVLVAATSALSRSPDANENAMELPKEEESAGTIWAPLFVAACVGFALYASLQLSVLRRDLRDNAELIDLNSDRIVMNDPVTVEPDSDSPIGLASAEDDPALTPALTPTVAPKVENEPELLAIDEPLATSRPERIERQALRIPLEDSPQAIPVIVPNEINATDEEPFKAPVIKTSEASGQQPGGEPAASLRRADIPVDLLELAGDGVAENAPRSLVAIFGEGNAVDMAQVVCAAQSHNGRLLATSSGNHRIRVWNVADRTVAVDLSGHDGPIYSLAFSPDSRLLAAGGTTDHEVRIWRVDDGSELYLLRGHSGWVTALAFSPDGEILATAGTDGNIMFWETATGRLARMIDGPEGQTIHTLAFSPDGASLAVGGVDKRITLRDVSTGMRLRVLAGHDESVRSLAFSADGNHLVSGSEDKTVKIWNLEDAAADPITLSHHENWVRSVTYSPDSKRIASSGYDGKVHICDATSGDLMETLEINPPGKQVVQVMFSSSGRFLTTANGNGTTYVLRLEAE